MLLNVNAYAISVIDHLFTLMKFKEVLMNINLPQVSTVDVHECVFCVKSKRCNNINNNHSDDNVNGINC